MAGPTTPVGSPGWWETIDDMFGSRFGVTGARTGGLSMGATRGVRLPQCSKFDDTDTKFPSWVQSPYLQSTVAG